MSWARALGIALGFAADRLFGDPQRGHPVAGFGNAAAALERRTYADSKAAGVVHEALLVGSVVAGGVALEGLVRGPRTSGSPVVGTVRGTQTSGSPPPQPLRGLGCPEPSPLTARPRAALLISLRSLGRDLLGGRPRGPRASGWPVVGTVRGTRTSGSPPPQPLRGNGSPEPSPLTARPRAALLVSLRSLVSSARVPRLGGLLPPQPSPLTARPRAARSVFLRSRVAFVAEAALTAAATFAVLGGETLGREAEAVASRLEADDLPGARTQVGRIVGRRTAELSGEDVARAAVETVAENTSDAIVAPLFWGGVFGIPGLVGYRAVNTLDAMVGYRSPRYRNFGWAAARLDDLANWGPARLSAALVAVVRPRSAATVWRTVRRDAAQHPSPNAGQVESAFAAALDVRLGGSNTYDGVTEDRGTLGDGRTVQGADVRRAVRLSRAVGLAGAVVAVLIASRRP